jgi:hypothetical protein
MFENIKNNIFTIHGVITTLIHLFLVVGFLTCWITFKVYVLGQRPVAPWASQGQAQQSAPTPPPKARG